MLRCTLHLFKTDCMPLNYSHQITFRTFFLWYEQNLCNVDLRDPRGFRVRFQAEHFIHQIKLTTKYGKEPKKSTTDS